MAEGQRRRDNEELVRVGDDDAFDVVGVISGAPQRASPRLDAHDPGERIGPAAGIADQRDPVPDDDALAGQLTGPHRDNDPLGSLTLVQQQGVATTIDPGDEPTHRAGMRRPILRTGA